MSAGFRFALMLENGEPAEPAVFPTIVPTWQVGDTFLAGRDLRCLRILGIEPEMDEGAEFDALWVVERVDA
jgi:hypothetical protein